MNRGPYRRRPAVVEAGGEVPPGYTAEDGVPHVEAEALLDMLAVAHPGRSPVGIATQLLMALAIHTERTYPDDRRHQVEVVRGAAQTFRQALALVWQRADREKDVAGATPRGSA